MPLKHEEVKKRHLEEHTLRGPGASLPYIEDSHWFVIEISYF
jgi:hypothetical protein